MSARKNNIKLMVTSINLIEINQCYQEGYALFTDGQYTQALRYYYTAWLYIPKPQTNHPISATVLAAIGHTYYKMRKYTLAIEALRSALNCPKTDEQGIIFLRLGQSLYSIRNEQQAQIYLKCAHSIGGDLLFANENPRYLRSIQAFIE